MVPTPVGTSVSQHPALVLLQLCRSEKKLLWYWRADPHPGPRKPSSEAQPVLLSPLRPHFCRGLVWNPRPLFLERFLHHSTFLNDDIGIDPSAEQRRLLWPPRPLAPATHSRWSRGKALPSHLGGATRGLNTVVPPSPFWFPSSVPCWGQNPRTTQLCRLTYPTLCTLCLGHSVCRPAPPHAFISFISKAL